MATERTQSDLAEVKDQLSLDFADGKYLNVIGNNYGLRRSDVNVSSLNFDDNTWRALVKVIALQYKQILTKFEQILEIILGPKITQVGTFSADILAGVQFFQVNSHLQFPQVGTLILDEGLATEETVEVCFIDRYTDTVYLTAVTLFDHQAEDEDAEEPLTLDMLAGDTEVYIPFSENFPTADFPYTLVLGRGTDNEEVVQLTGNDVTNNILTISACLNSHGGSFPTQIQDTMSADYVDASYFIKAFNVDAFDESGVVILGASDNDFTAVTPFSVNNVVAAPGTFTVDRHVRSRVVFEGNATAALAGVEAEIITSTTDTLTFLSPISVPPIATDRFKIRPVVEYVSISQSDLSINLRRDIVDLTLVATTSIEMLTTSSLISLGPVKMVGVGWDVFQIDAPGGPPTVEILLPASLREDGALRKDSYFHTTYVTPVPATTLVGAIAADADIYPVADNTGFPVAGVVTLDAGGGDEDVIAYTIDVSSTSADILTGATTVTIDSGGDFFSVPFEVQLDDGGGGAEKVTVTALNNNVATIGATSGPHLKGAEFRAVEYIRSGVAGATPTYSGGESVDLYEPRYAGQTVLDGNLWTVDDTFPGPYVYSPSVLGIEQVNSTANTTLNQRMVSGPVKVMISQQPGRTALEVEDASAFPLATALQPFSLVIGTGGPNRETIDGNSVSLRQRTFALLDAGGGTQAAGSGSLVFDNLDEMTALGFIGGSSDFPDVNGYRIRIDEGGVNDEILFVIDTTGGDTLVFENNTENPHVAGEVARLMADVIGTDILTDVHDGVYNYADREIQVVDPTGPDPGFPANNNGQYFSDIRYNAADIAQPEYDDLPVLSAVGLPLVGASLYFNFGDQRINATDVLSVAAIGTFAVPVATLTGTDTTVFPSSADAYPYVITIEPGTVREEVLEVIDNNTGTGVITVYDAVPTESGAPMVFTHPVGSKIVFTPGKEDTLAYQTVSGSDIEFSPADTFNQTFYAGTTVTLSPGLDIPQITGYDFPLSLPSDVEEALQAVLNLIRAAGVLVTFIDQP